MKKHVFNTSKLEFSYKIRIKLHVAKSKMIINTGETSLS